MQLRVHVYVRLQSWVLQTTVVERKSIKQSRCILLYWLLYWQVTTNRSTNRRMKRRKRGGEESVLTVFLNGGGGRELVSARSDAKLAGDDRCSVSSQVFRPRNDISGFYPHRVMRHNAVASIMVHNEARRRASPFSFSWVSRNSYISPHFAFPAGPTHVSWPSKYFGI